MPDLFDEPDAPSVGQLRGGLTLDQYISMLLAIRQAHPKSGTWLVNSWSPSRGRFHTSPPSVAYRRTAQGVPLGQFWHITDGDQNRGSPLVRL